MPDKVCELVSLTHQLGDTLVSDIERVVVTGNARSVGLSASVAPLPAQRFGTRWTGHPVTALSTLAVSAAVGLHLCYVTYST